MLKAKQLGKMQLAYNEDSLTSSVFQLLCYLPTDLMWKFLQESCYGNHLPTDIGKLENVEYWCHWKVSEDEHELINNKNFVEPDVFMSFEKLDFIIEAKRWDNKQQYHKQWITELKGYRNEFKKDGTDKQVILLALGGINKKEKEVIEIDGENFLVIKCRWKRLLETFIAYRKELEKGQNNSSFYEGHMAIINDLILSLELHGYFGGIWFEKETRLKELKPNLKNITLWQPIN